MFKIIKKERLNPTVTKMVIDAPFIAKKAEPGQFIILRALEDSERIPLTIADYDREGGTITIIYQIVGGETKFACVDGPDFDGHLVDFDEAMKRSTMYREFEQHASEAHCNLMNKEVK